MNENNRKISILTFWGVPNYGAFAQAYALNRKIKEMFPEYEVEHIGYLSSEHKRSYFEKKKPIIRLLGKPNQVIFYKSIYWYFISLSRYYREPQPDYRLFKSAWNSIPNIHIDSAKKLEEHKWDTIVTGSDCIWQFSTESFGHDDHLIGKNLRNNKLVAYACSFGNQNENIPDFVADQLLKYDWVSIRDTFSENLVKSLTDGQCKTSLVLDPTLIYDFKSDSNIVPYRNDGKKYILVYGDVFPRPIVREIREYAKKHELQTIGVGKAPQWCDIVMKEVHPFEWIGMFQHAEFVFTNTFHGMMFCLIYNKVFYFQQEPYVKNRSAYILELLGLDKLFLSKDFNIQKMFTYDWDYKTINAILEEKRRKSINFLYEALR